MAMASEFTIIECNSSPFYLWSQYGLDTIELIVLKYIYQDNFSRKLLIVSSSSSNATAISATTPDPSFLLH
jgi:hypothetical protein